MGELVQIEEREPEEVFPDILKFKHVRVRNPAFDVTPHSYIDIICTEVGAIPPEMSYLIIKEKLGWEMEETASISSISGDQNQSCHCQ
jgi:ribose 1,5-bisphosphate isomerase